VVVQFGPQFLAAFDIAREMGSAFVEALHDCKSGHRPEHVDPSAQRGRFHLVAATLVIDLACSNAARRTDGVEPALYLADEIERREVRGVGLVRRHIVVTTVVGEGNDGRRVVVQDVAEVAERKLPAQLAKLGDIAGSGKQGASDRLHRATDHFAAYLLQRVDIDDPRKTKPPETCWLPRASAVTPGCHGAKWICLTAEPSLSAVTDAEPRPARLATGCPCRRNTDLSHAFAGPSPSAKSCVPVAVGRAC